MTSHNDVWEQEVYKWRRWALSIQGRIAKDYQQASDEQLRKEIEQFLRESASKNQ